MAKGSTIRKNKYNKRVYEQIPLRVKKGEKEGISQCAQRYGMSTNAFILNAIDAYRISLHRDMIANLKEMIRPIAKKYGVESVYLFGSRARGDYRADSDFDFYIIVNDDAQNLVDLTAEAYKSIRSVRSRAVDIVIGTESRFESRKNKSGIENEVMNKGVLLYG
jgi:predicted nucleotidyltransferase